MHERPLQLVVSIGTGKPADASVSKHHKWATKHLMENFGTARAILQLLTECQQTHLDVDEKLDEKGVQYHRFNASNEVGRIPLDEWKGVQTLENIKRLTIGYLKQTKTDKSLLMCARTLVEARRQRAATERWESFATSYVYYCREARCKSTFESRAELRNHAYDAHGFVWETQVRGADSQHWACFWDQCQHNGVYIFHKEQEYLKHLNEEHSVRDGPKFSSRLHLEDWLDQGRCLPYEALDRLKQERKEASESGSG